MNVNFLTLLQRAARSCGLDPKTLSPELAESFATWLEARVRKAWHMALWPGTTLLEERALRAGFSLAVTYALGTEVYDAASRSYYRALQDGFSGQPVGNAAYWAPAPDLFRYLAMIMNGQAEIAEPLKAWAQDPRRFPGAAPVAMWHDGDKIYFSGTCPVTVWLRYRPAPPRLTAAEWDADAEYAIGDVIYWGEDGLPANRRDCYLATDATGAGESPESAGAKWCRQVVPEVLADYAVRGTKADWLSDDGQDDKATTAEGLALTWLNDRLADVTILQGGNQP